MPFDPKAYLSQGAAKPSSPGPSGGFDPKAYLSQGSGPSQDQPSDNTSSAGMAALEHFANGVSAGYLPQLQAMSQPAITKIMNLLTGQNVQDNSDYVSRRDEALKRLAKEKEDHPYIANTANIAGGVTGAMATGGLMPEIEGAGLLGRAAQAAAGGAIYGAASNPGDVEGVVDPTQLKDRAVNAGKGAALGAVLSGATDGVSSGLSSLKNSLASKAEEKAFKASGAMLKDFRLANNRDQVNKVGRQLLDDNIVTPFSTPSDIAERTGSAIEQKGSRLGDIINELDEKSQRTGANFSGIDRKEIADNMRKELLASDPSIPGTSAKNQRMESLISEFENGGDPKLGLADAENLKKQVADQVNWKRLPGTDVPLEEQVQRSLHSNLKNSVEDAAQSVEKDIHGPTANEFVDTKDAYGNLKTANKIAEDRISRDQARRAFGLTDTISGTGGAAVGGMLAGPPGAVVGGVVGGVGNKLARTYGDSLMATGLDKASNISGLLANYAKAAGKSPAAISALAGRAANPQSSFTPEQDVNPELMNVLTKNPELIDSLKDETLKKQLKSKLGRAPSDTPVPLQQAQDQFIKGN